MGRVGGEGGGVRGISYVTSKTFFVKLDLTKRGDKKEK